MKTTTVPNPITPATTSRLWLALALVLGLLWAAEVFAVQEYTLRPNYPLPLYKWIVSRMVRLTLDVLACTTFVLILRRVWLYVAFAASAAFSLGLLTYHSYFDRALSLTTLRFQSGEGLAVGQYVVELIDWPVAGGLVALLTIKVLLGHWLGRMPAPSFRGRLAIGGALAYIAVLVISINFIDPLSKLRRFATVGRLGGTYGYLATWMGEYWYLDKAALLEGALAAAKQRSDQLTPFEAPLDLGRYVVILQLESVGAGVIDARVDGKLVMPFLHGLRRSSRCYEIQAVHLSGSSDADFIMLTGQMPSGGVAPYRIQGFPYDTSLPRHVQRRGYRCVALHGNTGTFFERRGPYEQMGFETLLFSEEMVRDHRIPTSHWGVQDSEVFDLSSRLIHQAKTPLVHFIITLTSHGPFIYLDDEDKQLFPKPAGMLEDYLNSMRYLDNQLARYVESLPEGTTLVMYGDHESGVDFGQTPRKHKGRELVPLIIYQKGSNLAESQKTRGLPFATDGTLTMLDAATYLWNQFENFTAKVVPAADTQDATVQSPPREPSAQSTSP